MAEVTWPSQNHNGRFLTVDEYEALASVGMNRFDGLASSEVSFPFYSDGTGMWIKVRAGRTGWVRGREWNSGSTEFTVPVLANTSSVNRVDAIVLRLDRSTGDINVKVRSGGPSGVIPVPVQTTDPAGIFEVVVGEIAVGPGVTNIAAGKAGGVNAHYTASGVVPMHSQAPPASIQGALGAAIDTNTLYVCWDGAAWVPYMANAGTVNGQTVTSGTPTISIGAGVSAISGAIAFGHTYVGAPIIVVSPVGPNSSMTFAVRDVTTTNFKIQVTNNGAAFTGPFNFIAMGV